MEIPGGNLVSKKVYLKWNFSVIIPNKVRDVARTANFSCRTNVRVGKMS